MNNCPSHVDTVYYESKYKLEFHNKKEAIEHYIKIGKQRGYFPNREMEVFYCKTMNFDPEYYKRKYCISGDNKAVKRHWKLYGSKEGHYVNHCEETGRHTPFTCRCRIKNKSADKRYSEDCPALTDENNSIDDSLDMIQHSDADHYIFSEKVDKNKKQEKIMKTTKKPLRQFIDSESSKLSSSCPSRPDMDESLNDSVDEGIHPRKVYNKKKQRSKSGSKGVTDNFAKKKNNKAKKSNNKSESDSDELREEVEIALESDSEESQTVSDHVEQSERTDNSTGSKSNSKSRSKSRSRSTDNSVINTGNSVICSGKSDTESESRISDKKSSDSCSSNHSSEHSSKHTSESSESSECRCAKCVVETKQLSDNSQTVKKNAIYDSMSLAKKFRSKMNRYSVQTDNNKKIERGEKIDGSDKTPTNSPINQQKTEDTSTSTHVQGKIKPNIENVEKECGGNHQDSDSGSSKSLSDSGSDSLDHKVLQMNIQDNDSFDAYFVDDDYRVVDESHRLDIKISENEWNKSSKRTNEHSPESEDSGSSHTSSDCSCNNCVKVKPQQLKIAFDVNDSYEDSESKHNDTDKRIFTDVKLKLGNRLDDRESISRCALTMQKSGYPKEHIYNDENKSYDEIKLQRIQDNMFKKNDLCKNDMTDRYIIDKHMEIVCQNISNIKLYLNMCHIHLDTYTNILKQAYQCLTDICNPSNNYMVYNAARVKLCNMLKEAENMIKTSYYNDLPIFYNKTANKKSPSSIKFPMLICTSDTVNRFLSQSIGESHVHFKIQLMKISLRHLKLEKYCYPPLNRHEKITSETSPIPPCSCPVGKTPTREMYLESDLIKCWDMNYHLKQFENALYKITMTKEILCNYSKLIEIKEEHILNIKIANSKSE